MKWLKAYTGFNRTERMGIIALLSLLLILLLVRGTMHLWIKPHKDIAAQERLTAAWQQFKANAQKPGKHETIIAETIAQKKEDVVHERPANPPTLFFFDPNTIDSVGLRKLGLQEKTVSIFLHWRGKGKRFYKKENMKSLYTLTEEEYNRIESYIRIAPSSRQQRHKWE